MSIVRKFAGMSKLTLRIVVPAARVLSRHCGCQAGLIYYYIQYVGAAKEWGDGLTGLSLQVGAPAAVHSAKQRKH